MSLLLLLLALLSCMQLVSCELQSCWPRWDEYRAAIEPTQVVLTILRNTAYNASICSWTFAQHEDSYVNWVACHNQGRQSVHTCPVHCLRAANTSSAAAVLGSFPYHANSSICLSAIHSGIIGDQDGGAVLIQRFYPESWDKDSTQAIFPHDSHRPSYSNGVQSIEVPSQWRPVPSALDSFSFTGQAGPQ